MPMSRDPGRCNLHRLGWAAFEDLCLQVMRVVRPRMEGEISGFEGKQGDGDYKY